MDSGEDVLYKLFLFGAIMDDMELCGLKVRRLNYEVLDEGLIFSNIAKIILVQFHCSPISNTNEQIFYSYIPIYRIS